ncbi:MAG TPA: MAPEG family protein [Pyrinomonadaceae bacterium]
MTIPAWMLLGFASWTLLLLMVTVGIYRWSLILTGRREVSSFRADPIEEADWHKRGTRAHANCIENLPVFGAIVMALHVGHVTGFWVDAFSVAILVGRILQSTVHICFVQTNTAVSFRFSFLCVQLVGFVGLIWIIAARLGGNS